jgi:uncharacterized phiE125 gp8 family phage protein
MASLKLNTAPVLEPVSLGDVKDWNRIDTADHDRMLLNLMKGARQAIEEYLSRALITQTWVLKFDSFPVCIRPPRPPLQSVTSITYNDVDGNSQTVTAGDYTVDTNSEPGRIVEAVSATWPATRGHIDDVTVTFVAGYGDGQEDVPDEIRMAIKMLAGFYYDTPQHIMGGGELPSHVYRLIDTHRMHWRGYIGT